MAYKTDWGSSKNGCKVGFYYNDTLEYSADGSQARIHDWDIKFSSSDPIWDTSNDLSVSGGAITNSSWNNPFNKSSSWSGTMTLKTASGEWQTLDYGSSHTATASESLSGISYAGGTLTNTVTITYPARAYSLPAAGTAPTFSSVTSTSAQIDWTFPLATATNEAAPVTTTTLQYSNDGTTWYNLVTVPYVQGASVYYVHSGVTPGTSYYYRSVGSNSSGNGPASPSSSNLWTAPTAPTMGTVTRASDTSITIPWTNNHSGRASASANWIYQRTDGGDWVNIASVSATATSYTWTGGSANHYYEFTVNAGNAAGWGYGALSNMIANSITAPTSVAATTPTVTTAHGTGYDTTKQTSQTIVSWSHASPTYVQAYEVWVNGAKFGADTSSTSMVVTGLVAGSSNSIYVKAKRTSEPTGTSANSSTVTATAPTTLAAPVTVTLGAFTASGGKAAATLSWTAVSGASSYYVDKLSGGAVTGLGSVAGTSVALSAMDPNTTYQFVVYALNAVGYSSGTGSQAGTVTPTTPDAPQSVDASYSAGTLSFSWSAPADNGGATITGYQYKIERQDVANGAWILDADWASLGNVAAYSLEKPTVISYKVTVRAVNGIGAGAESFAETGLIGGYVRIKNAGGTWDDVFLKLNVSGAYSKSAIVRIYDGTDWVPLTYV